MNDTGLRVVRRRMVWLPAWAAMALMGGSVLAEGSNELGWDEFAKLADDRARSLSKGGSDSAYDAYLYAVATDAARLRVASIPKAKLGAFPSLDPPVRFGVGHRGTAVFAVEWHMEPGAVLPPHNHPNGSVCTLGLEGEARIRHFEPVGTTPGFDSTEAFRVRETRSDLVAPGRVSTLSPTRDNIHTFRAGDRGARGIDISAMHGKDAGFSFLAIDPEPADPERRLYTARCRKI